MNVMHSNRCMLPMQGTAIRQDNLGKYTSSCEQYTNCGKLMNIIFWNFELSSRMSSSVYLNFPGRYNILFTFLMDGAHAPNGIGHLMILN